ncbi:hypothetical protein CSTERLE_00690 [Thermoclostridium stercorarium subsp. leptospartum DSM 9219]|uniref:O-antigen ligase-related domain-containing protein n=1 Tax=Thermoclostridium stercorarium subsp. leptospartum DSM 9219 TaxID=1346611 RepID=A0A1B1YHI5_THEST|nr:O-antigen ligase family protein [Thermoclostridium stercorarium]ANX00211.1 hypothetical protein CSTERLE_00690 [Thermoclostridium stercorarium subsp. leptospartum DSM 9219]
MNNIHNVENNNFITYLLIIYIGLTIFNKFQFGVTLSGVILPIVIFLLIVFLKNAKIYIMKNHFYITLFWIFAVYSSLRSIIVKPSRNIFTFLIFVIFYIISTAIIYNQKDIKMLIKSYIFFSFIASINIIKNFIMDFEYVWKRYSLYVFGIYRDPNYVSAFILPAIAIIFYIIVFSRNISIKKRVLYMIFLAIMITGVLSTGSRAAFLVLIFTIILIFILYKIKNKNYKIAIRVLLLIAVVIVFFKFTKKILPDFLINRFLDFKEYSQDSRLVFWSKGIKLISKYPLLGAGIGGLNNYLNSLGLNNSHNMFLDILIDQGIVGILLLGLIFKNYLFVKKDDRVIMLIMMFSSFSPYFLINGFNTASFWTPMIICGIFSNYSRLDKVGLKRIIENL